MILFWFVVISRDSTTENAIPHTSTDTDIMNTNGFDPLNHMYVAEAHIELTQL